MEAVQNQHAKKKHSNFLIQGSILAAAGIIVRIIGMVYRIPLTHIIGDEGNGYYSTAFSIYTIVLLLTSYSLPLAVSKMVSARLNDTGYKSVRRILITALVYATVVGAISCALLWFGADWIAGSYFKLPPAAYAIRSLAPTVWIMAYLGVMRGYYQGHSTMVPTAMSQICEQIINAVISIVAALLMMGGSLIAISHAQISSMGEEQASRLYGLGAAGGTIGTGAGALSALILLLILFFSQRKLRSRQMKAAIHVSQESYATIAKILFMTVVPVILSTAIYNISGIIDVSLYGQMTSSVGEHAKTAAELGVYSTKYKLLINIPVAMANALSSSLIPALSQASSTGNKGQVTKNVSMSIRFAMIIAIPAAVGLCVLARPIITLLFGRSDSAVTMMYIGCLSVVFYSLSTISNAILQGIGHMRIPVRHAAISVIAHIGILVVLIGLLHTGIYALVIADLIFALGMCILNALSIRKHLNYKQEVRQTYVLPGICAIIMGVITWGVYYGLGKVVSSNLILTLIPGCIAVCVYGVLLLKLGCISEIELKSWPKGRSLVNIARKLKLL